MKAIPLFKVLLKGRTLVPRLTRMQKLVWLLSVVIRCVKRGVLPQVDTTQVTWSTSPPLPRGT